MEFVRFNRAIWFALAVLLVHSTEVYISPGIAGTNQSTCKERTTRCIHSKQCCGSDVCRSNSILQAKQCLECLGQTSLCSNSRDCCEVPAGKNPLVCTKPGFFSSSACWECKPENEQCAFSNICCHGFVCGLKKPDKLWRPDQIIVPRCYKNTAHSLFYRWQL